MTSLALPLDNWEIGYHESMAAVLRVQQDIRNQGAVIAIAWELRSCANRLKDVLRLRVDLQAWIDDQGDEFVAPDETLHRSMRSTTNLIESINSLLAAAKTARLMDRKLTHGPLLAIRKHRDEIAEFLDIFQMSVDPDVESAIRRGREDFAAGRGVSLDSLLQE